MKKHEIAKKIANRMDGLTLQQIEDCVDLGGRRITKTLAEGDFFNQKNFDTFKCVDRAPRKGRNPQTREVVDIPATRALKVVVSKSLKDTLNK